ncbi:MAG TPA: nitroreductase family protein [Streptosporangiaceae bacterium]|jgi:nitroreductase|nr:nitroreductase family protein [Streptosporangiaceae bacterium]
MEFSDVIKKRKMVRAYTDEPVAPEARERILSAANRAPSAGFSQGYALMTLEGQDQLGPFWELVTRYHGDAGPSFDPVTKAPLVVIPLSCKEIYLDRYSRQDKGWTDKSESHWPVPYWDIDTGFTALLMLLAAVDEGLGALFFGIAPHQIAEFRELFGVPETYLPIGAVAIGHPDAASDNGGSAKVIKRRTLDDLVHRGRW